MATKKKATVKKAAPKKAPAKKTTAKKRAYARKPKVEEQAPPKSDVASAEAPDMVTMSHWELESLKRLAACEAVKSYIDARAQLQEANVTERRDALSRLDYLDISDLPKDTRLVLLLELDDMGFVTDRAQSLVGHYFVNDILDAEALELNHNNKIVREVSKTNSGFQKSQRIGRPLSINVEAEMLYSGPGDNLPESIEQDGATYVRIN